jgi:hypothetical protein
MAQNKREALEREIRRWARPDAHLFVRPDWRRFVKPGSDAAMVFEIYERKFRVDQLRDWRGRFADEAGGASAIRPTPVAARISASRRAECELQQRHDTFICNAIGTRSCWAQAAFRFSQCLKGGYVPPLSH